MVQVRIERSRPSPSQGRDRFVAVIAGAGEYNGARYGSTERQAFKNIVEALRERGYEGDVVFKGGC